MAVSTNTLTINGVNSGDYGLLLTSDTWLNAPEIGYEAYQIPRRSGDLIRQEHRMNNILRRFELFTKGANARANVEAFRKVIYTRPFGMSELDPRLNYSQIRSSYDPSFLTYGYPVGEIEVEPFLSGDALSLKVTMTFSCNPRKDIIGASYNLWHMYCGPFRGAINRGNPIMRQILSGTDAEYEHIADYFYLFYMTSGNLGSSDAWYENTINSVTDARPYFVAIAYELNGVYHLANDDDYSLYGRVPTRTRNVTGVNWYVIAQAVTSGNIHMNTAGSPGYQDLSLFTRTYEIAAAVGYYPTIYADFSLTSAVASTANSLIMIEGVSAPLEPTPAEPEVVTFRKIMVLRWDLMPSSVKSFLISNAFKRTVRIDDATFSCMTVSFQQRDKRYPYLDLTSGQEFDLSPYVEEYGQSEGPAEKIRITALSSGTGNGGLIQQDFRPYYWKV